MGNFPIEIDGLPSDKKMGGTPFHGELLVITRPGTFGKHVVEHHGDFNHKRFRDSLW